MTINTKIELLKYKLLHQNFDYEIEVYNLLENVKINDVVSKIDDLSFSFQVEPEKDKITAQHFLICMNELVKYMKFYFYNMLTFQVCLKEIVNGSQNELNDLLNVKETKYFNNNIIRKNVYKLIISNFIKNAKYVPSIRNILEDNNIALKELDNYTFQETETILMLLSNIVLSQRGRGLVSILFINIDDHLKEYLKRKAKVNSKKYSINDYKNKYLDSYINNYNKIFKIYNSKKKYLKYFN